MKNGNAFKGLGVAMVTPFTEKRTVDYSGLQRLTEHLIAGGVDYLVVHGTTGESATLSKQEKRSTLDFILEVNNKRLPVVLGIGGNNTAAIAQEMETTDFKGVIGVLSVSPAYNRPTQEGIYQHFKTIAEACPLPIILYNVPSRTASNMEAETTLRIARDVPNVVAIKEASGDMNQITRIIKDCPEGFTVISGDDAMGLSVISSGGKGVISVIGNAFPKDYGAMVHSGLDGDMMAAGAQLRDMLNIIEMIFIEGNPGGIKEVLQYLNICENYMRLPLVRISKEARDLIYRSLAEGTLAHHL